MLFNSSEFLIFLPTVFLIYWYLLSKKTKVQNFFLLVSSYVFYGWWDWRFLFLIILSTTVDYLVGLKISSSNEISKKKIFLWVSILFNICLLGFFKYYNFFIDSLVSLIGVYGYESSKMRSINVLLPVGISFYTFQTMSYSLDIYFGKLKPTRDLISFALFVSFFPQLVAGPIERASNLLPQILNKRIFNYAQAVDGLRLILWGMFKKIVIAYSFAWRVDYCFQNYSSLDGGTLFLGLIYFSFQIYCDFSAYSDIAIGISKLFGFELMSNFKFPYFSKNIYEFWNRWHISLSSWLKDYVYIPLGGSRLNKLNTSRNILIVFILSGFWHGANWTFILWGLWHGFIYIFFKIFDKNINFTTEWDGRYFNFFTKCTKVGLNFILVTISWVFFRSQNITESFSYFSKILSEFSLPITNKGGLVTIILFISLEFLFRKNERKIINFKNLYLRWIFYFALSFSCFAYFDFFDEINFIYFQF